MTKQTRFNKPQSDNYRKFLKCITLKQNTYYMLFDSTVYFETRRAPQIDIMSGTHGI